MFSNEQNACVMAADVIATNVVGTHVIATPVIAADDHRSDSVRRITSPALPKPGSKRVPAPSPSEQIQLPISPAPPAMGADDIFHDSLIDSNRESQRNPLAALGAIAFQSLLLLAVIAFPLFHIDILPKQEVLSMLYLPPAPAAASAVKLPTFKSYASTSSAIHIPTPRAPQASPPPVPATDGVVGGVPGGVIGEVPGGVLSNVLGSTHTMPSLAKTSTLAPSKRMRIASRVAEANLIHDVAPIYPPEAGRARLEGTVVLIAVIARDGTVRDVRVQSGPPLLVQAAVDAVRQWRYRPYLLNGEPVEVDSQITINFNLSRG